jgi:hypothetical protein
LPSDRQESSVISNNVFSETSYAGSIPAICVRCGSKEHPESARDNLQMPTLIGLQRIYATIQSLMLGALDSCKTDSGNVFTDSSSDGSNA